MQDNKSDRDIWVYRWPDDTWRLIDGDGVTEARRIFLPSGHSAVEGKIMGPDGPVELTFAADALRLPDGRTPHVSDIRRR